MSERTAFPLSWPDGWKRMQSGSRTHAQFGLAKMEYQEGQWVYAGKNRISVADAVGRLVAELRRMGIPNSNVIISTNVPLRLDGMPRFGKEPADSGAAVYWKKNDKQPMRCMAIDRYTRVADNLAAIAATLEAMRAIERHGGGTILERAFLGFRCAALERPRKTGVKCWVSLRPLRQRGPWSRIASAHSRKFTIRTKAATETSSKRSYRRGMPRAWRCLHERPRRRCSGHVGSDRARYRNSFRTRATLKGTRTGERRQAFTLSFSCVDGTYCDGKGERSFRKWS